MNSAVRRFKNAVEAAAVFVTAAAIAVFGAVLIIVMTALLTPLWIVVYIVGGREAVFGPQAETSGVEPPDRRGD